MKKKEKELTPEQKVELLKEFDEAMKKIVLPVGVFFAVISRGPKSGIDKGVIISVREHGCSWLFTDINQQKVLKQGGTKLLLKDAGALEKKARASIRRKLKKNGSYEFYGHGPRCTAVREVLFNTFNL